MTESVKMNQVNFNRKRIPAGQKLVCLSNLFLVYLGLIFLLFLQKPWTNYFPGNESQSVYQPPLNREIHEGLRHRKNVRREKKPNPVCDSVQPNQIQPNEPHSMQLPELHNKNSRPKAVGRRRYHEIRLENIPVPVPMRSTDHPIQQYRNGDVRQDDGNLNQTIEDVWIRFCIIAIDIYNV